MIGRLTSNAKAKVRVGSVLAGLAPVCVEISWTVGAAVTTASFFMMRLRWGWVDGHLDIRYLRAERDWDAQETLVAGEGLDILARSGPIGLPKLKVEPKKALGRSGTAQ